VSKIGVAAISEGIDAGGGVGFVEIRGHEVKASIRAVIG